MIIDHNEEEKLVLPWPSDEWIAVHAADTLNHNISKMLAVLAFNADEDQTEVNMAARRFSLRTVKSLLEKEGWEELLQWAKSKSEEATEQAQKEPERATEIMEQAVQDIAESAGVDDKYDGMLSFFTSSSSEDEDGEPPPVFSGLLANR